jgi:hypothetical protein
MRIDADRATVEGNRAMFTDADGNLVQVQVTGPGALDIYRDVTNGRAADIRMIELHDTDDRRTRVSVSVRRDRNADNLVAIGGLRGDAGSGLGMLNARQANLTGDVSLSGGLEKLMVNDVADGVSIDLAGDSARQMTFMAGNVGDDVTLSTTQSLRTLRVNTWASGAVQAAVMNTVMSRGAFGADLMNTRTNFAAYGIRNVRVGGDFTSAITTDRLGTVQVIGGDARIDLNVTTDQISIRDRSAVQAIRVMGGDLVLPSLLLKPDTVLKQLMVKARRGVGGMVTGPATITGELGRVHVDGQAGDVRVNGQAVDLMA